jgi:hypothetical protein
MANRACEAFLTPARDGSAGIAGIGIGQMFLKSHATF